MSLLMDLPVALAAAPFDPVGKTVAEVVDQVEQALRRTEIEPEYVSIANFMDDGHAARFGLPGSSPWTDAFVGRRRLSLSIERGNSEGWIIQTDFIRFVEQGEGGHWQSQPVMRIKTLSRSQAWSVAAVVSRLLGLD